MGPTTPVLSSETIAHLNGAIARIIKVKTEIYDKVVADEAFTNDEGVTTLFIIVRNFAGRLKPTSEAEAAEMPAGLTHFFTDRIAPSLSAVADLIEKTWADVQMSVTGGKGGAVVVDAFVKSAQEDQDGPVLKLESAMDDMVAAAQASVLDEAVDLFAKVAEALA